MDTLQHLTNKTVYISKTSATGVVVTRLKHTCQTIIRKLFIIVIFKPLRVKEKRFCKGNSENSLSDTPASTHNDYTSCEGVNMPKYLNKLVCLPAK